MLHLSGEVAPMGCLDLRGCFQLPLALSFLRRFALVLATILLLWLGLAPLCAAYSRILGPPLNELVGSEQLMERLLAATLVWMRLQCQLSESCSSLLLAASFLHPQGQVSLQQTPMLWFLWPRPTTTVTYSEIKLPRNAPVVNHLLQPMLEPYPFAYDGFGLPCRSLELKRTYSTKQCQRTSMRTKN